MWREREVALLVCHTPDETPENRRTQLNSGKQILCLKLKIKIKKQTLLFTFYPKNKGEICKNRQPVTFITRNKQAVYYESNR